MSADRQIKTNEVSAPITRLTATERDARNLVLASTARSWEGEVNDLVHMSRVFLTVLESELTGSKDPNQDNTYLITQERIDQIFFCAYQSQRLAEGFNEAYYGALKA